MTKKRALTATALVIASAGQSWQVASGGGWIYAKAALAKGPDRRRLGRDSLTTGIKIKPWPWADTWPVAKLRFPTHKRDITVLAGAQGATLAFGPGHLERHRQTGRNGVTASSPDTATPALPCWAISNPATRSSVQNDKDGFWYSYRVTGSSIVDSRKNWYPPEPDGQTSRC